jgi:hypothetical protein
MPVYFHLLTALFFAISSCTTDTTHYPDNIQPNITSSNVTAKTIKDISLPTGFNYAENNDTIYAHWLLDLGLKENKTVYLYNGDLKPDQNVQYGVLNIDIGKKDLVQCADAVIKLRADFLFAKHRYSELNFTVTSGDSISFEKWLKGFRWKEHGSKLRSYKTNMVVSDSQKEFNKFMELVYSYCGSYSLSKELRPVSDINTIQPGDVFVKGGFPGHAITVMAVAKNSAGERIFLLSQGYMPAQDIHILKNYNNPKLSPWYSVKDIYPLYTPQWQFQTGSLKRW